MNGNRTGDQASLLWVHPDGFGFGAIKFASYKVFSEGRKLHLRAAWFDLRIDTMIRDCSDNVGATLSIHVRTEATALAVGCQGSPQRAAGSCLLPSPFTCPVQCPSSARRTLHASHCAIS